MKIFNFIVLTILFSLFSESIIAQSRSTSLKLEKINEELSASQLKKIKKANNFIASGEVFMQEVKALEMEIFNEQENIRNSSDRRAKKTSEKNIKALEEEGHFKLINATKTVEKGYDISYDVYAKKVEELRKNSADSDLNKSAKKNSYDAKFKFVEAKGIIDKLTDVDTYEYLSRQVKLSKQLKREGISLLLEAICMYIDCSEPVVENNNTDNNTNEANNSSNNNHPLENSSPPMNKKKVQNKNYIYFTVQILAVTNVLPSIRVNNFYRGNKNVTITHHNGLWKYLVGRFDNYKEALSFQQGIGRDSFVVAIKDGQRIEDITTIVDINGNWKK